jgi:hypothetical protein
MSKEMDNPNPEIFQTEYIKRVEKNETNENERDDFDALEIFGFLFIFNFSDLIRHIMDPEHPCKMKSIVNLK